MLVNFQMAKESLNISEAVDDLDAKIQDQLDMASQIVIDYIKRPEHGWTQDTTPLHVKAAVLHILRRIHDDPMGELEGGWLSPVAKDLLHRERDPALA